MKDILEYRIKLLSEAQDNKQLQAIEIETCKKDILYFFKNYLYTDKNSSIYTWDEPNCLPFVPYEFQEEYITEVWDSIMQWTKPYSERTDLTNIFVEKSRQMGISWVTMAIFVYWFIFYNHKYLVISQKWDDVDKIWNMKALLEKVRFMIRNIPKWMQPKWYDHKFMTISRWDWTWSITWESANPDASRWWTYHAIFMDEMASMQNAVAINTAASSATPCRIFNSTPKWEWNEFYRMRKATTDFINTEWQLVKASIKWLRYHWTEHPLYTTEWYNLRIQGMSPEKIAQELEIDYNTSVEWRVYKDFPKTATWVKYDPNKPLYIWMDNSHWWDDPHAIIVIQPEDHYFNIIDSLEINVTPEQCAEFLSCQPRFVMSMVQENFLQRWKTYNRQKAVFISDPYDTKVAMWNSTILDDYKKVWINLFLPRERNKEEQIMKTRKNIYKIRYNNNCLDFASSLMNARYPERKENSNNTSSFTKPVHDWTSHFRTALEYFVTYFEENPLAKAKKQVVKDTRPIRDKRTWRLIYR